MPGWNGLKLKLMPSKLEMDNARRGLKVHVNGIVQGVGFRPFVYGLARSLNLTGWVRNSSSGVDIELAGQQDALDEFLLLLNTESPKLSRLDSITALETPADEYYDFSILESLPEPGKFIPISPDVTICEDCARELLDPHDRRYRYPFINCTNCGPRFSIIQDIPYDRPNTTMAVFPMCPDCAAEYHNPSNRRFHAQPIACPHCGPQVEYYDAETQLVIGESAIQKARQAIMDGKILAIKGLGGYHLACDAYNQAAVTTLHIRKNRSEKPFALMAANISTIQKYTQVDPSEESMLISVQHPIVLLTKTSDALDHTAPGQNSLGFMLPYTPLHVLLCEPTPGFTDVLVMTSGNISEEPIAYEEADASTRLTGIADAFLTHNRDIHMRVDDSVIRAYEDRPYLLRRARGYAPDPILFPMSLPKVLACGAELKNTFALSNENYVFLSHHIGDLQNYETLKSYETGIHHFESLFRVNPEVIAIDLHPDYLSTRHGKSLAREKGLPLVEVQHHHAHLAACLADNQWSSDQPVIGLIFDGTGYGTDGAIWGGEILVGGYQGYQRRFHLEEMPLPGGDSAIRNPARIAMAYLMASGLPVDPSLAPATQVCGSDRTTLRAQIEHRINTPLTTSVGRLFDAVSSLLGVCHKATYEGQAAIELEAVCDPMETGEYPFNVTGELLPVREIIRRVAEDLLAHTPVNIISARFHNTLSHICLDACNQVRLETGIDTVALSGGVWQNMTLLRKTVPQLRASGFKILVHHQVPANDGGIALGQVIIATKFLEQSR